MPRLGVSPFERQAALVATEWRRSLNAAGTRSLDAPPSVVLTASSSPSPIVCAPSRPTPRSLALFDEGNSSSRGNDYPVLIDLPGGIAHATIAPSAGSRRIVRPLP